MEEKLSWPDYKERYEILHSFLMRMHLARWTHHTVDFANLLEKLAAYSYARTNSNGHEEEEEQQQIRTLLALNNETVDQR